MKRRKTSPSESAEIRSLRVLSYNIHQGKTAHRRQINLSILKEAIKTLNPDVVMLQEVAGSTRPGPHSLVDAERAYQMELLADTIWPYHAYQKNSLFSGGYHGNAILSRFPIVNWHLLNITVKGLKKRGVLHGEIELPGHSPRLHVLATHLGLMQYERHRQVHKICGYVKKAIPSDSLLLIGGDFNDWRERISDSLSETLRMEEAFLTQDAKHAKTFPSQMPVLRLDRIYYRGLALKQAMTLKGRPWKYLSDHLPVVAHFSLGH